MKVGRLITVEGIEFNLEGSQLKELTEYLKQQEENAALAADADFAQGEFALVDPENYERVLQAAYLVQHATGVRWAA
jgi:hypothetical protein